MSAKRELEGGYRNESEQQLPRLLADAFQGCSAPVEQKLESFVKYVRRQAVTRLIAQYDLVKKIVDVEGVIVECGVHRGATLLGWMHLTSIVDPVNWRRKIYGFDTFCGFDTPSAKDYGCEDAEIERGDYSSDSQDEIERLCRLHDGNRFLGHIEKVALIRGDAAQTMPEFLKKNPHILIALLFLDFDLYEPTKAALNHFVPRMPKGSLLVFDELNHPLWPGETLALLETLGARNLRIKRLPYYPNMSFAVL